MTVTGERNGFRSSIDGRSYSVANDLQATTGSVADVLRNVPSVDVDVQGNVSLRGDPNVSFLIDGKPSGMLAGEGRGDALLQMSADQIDRVEVLTNPSAAFRPDGTGGVINLITKKRRPGGAAATVRANLGDRGRANGSVSGSYNSGKLTVSGDAGVRRNVIENQSSIERARLDGGGGLAESLQEADIDTVAVVRSLRLGVDYDLGPATRLSAEVQGRTMQPTIDSSETFAGVNEIEDLVRGYDRTSRTATRRVVGEVSGTLTRRFSGDGHQLSAVASFERNESDRDLQARILNRVPDPSELQEDFRTGSDGDLLRFKTDYSRPLPERGMLRAGYEVEAAFNDYEFFGSRGPVGEPLKILRGVTNQFRYDQTVNALYGVLQRPFGDVTIQGGMRLEQVDREIDQVTTGVRETNDYFRVYPTAHLAYELSEQQTLTASYSRRVQRPRAEELNPFPIYDDPFNLRAGDPGLEPQDTHAVELGWQRRAGQTYYLATLYHRDTRNAITDVVRDLGGGVFLTTRENLGSRRAAGLELVANGRLTPKLTYNVSGNLFCNEIDARRLGFSETRSGTSMSVRGSATWQPTPRDLIQFNGFLNGEQLTPQGVRSSWGIVHFGYRRTVNDRLALIFTSNHVLRLGRDVLELDAPDLRERRERSLPDRFVFVGLSYALSSSDGRKRQREQTFDFEGSAS